MNDGRRELWIGTRDGLYHLTGTAGGDAWERRGPYLAGEDVGAVACRPDGVVLAGTHAGTLHRSADGGATWRRVPFDNKQAELNAYYAAYQSPIVQSGTGESGVWSLAFAPDAPDTVYAGVLPAALFRSRDGGESWEEIAGLRRLPASQEFWGPFRAPFLHTIVPDAGDPRAMTVAVSVGGVFDTADGGETWATRTAGMDPWYPDGARFPEVHKDVHKLRVSPADLRRRYITEHGPWISRSDDGGLTWRRLPAGHERTVTRPIALHPDDPDRLWLALLEDGVEGESLPHVRERLEVLESRDGGLTWADRSAGLPAGACNVYREGFDSDRRAPLGLYLGTSAGDLFFTTVDAACWRPLAGGLPSIRAVVPS